MERKRVSNSIWLSRLLYNKHYLECIELSLLFNRSHFKHHKLQRIVSILMLMLLLKFRSWFGLIARASNYNFYWEQCVHVVNFPYILLSFEPEFLFLFISNVKSNAFIIISEQSIVSCFCMHIIFIAHFYRFACNNLKEKSRLT